MNKIQVKYRFDTVTIRKILKGAAIAGGAVVLTYLSENLTQLDFGAYTGLVVGILSIIINTVREFLKGVPTNVGVEGIK